VGAAVRNGPARAQQCQRRLDGFEIHTNRPWNSDHAVGCSRVAMKVGFGLEE
jgi:flavin-binding protein dodecin